MAQVDGIEVVDQDHGLGVFAFFLQILLQMDGKILLLDLSLDAFQLCLAGPAFKDIVLDQLLGNGGCTFVDLEAAGHVLDRSTDDAVDIDSVMGIESFVLDDNEGIADHLGNVIRGDRDTVGIRRDQLGRLVALGVIYKGGIALGTDVDVAYGRSAVDDALEHTVGCEAADDHGADDCQEDKMGDEKTSSFQPLFPFGVQLILTAPKTFFTIIHKNLWSFLCCLCNEK